LAVRRALADDTAATVSGRPVADAATWSRAIREESLRVARFGHDATVVMLEVPRLQVLADRLGGGVADRVATEAARLLASETRSVDRIARLGEARFGVLLLETDEGAAGGYIARVREATDRWLESTGLSIRVSFGWASPTEGDSLMAAAATAEQRMHDAGHGARAVDSARDESPDGIRSVPSPGVGWP
jgi:diguanylate cyclase (GGDEF)-like protein